MAQVGCALDMDRAELYFFRNGSPQGDDGAPNHDPTTQLAPEQQQQAAVSAGAPCPSASPSASPPPPPLLCSAVKLDARLDVERLFPAVALHSA
jgi:hypothetical protein